MHLQKLADMGDEEAQAELDAAPSCPPLGAYLWSYWLQLHATRQGGGMGPSRLTRQEIRLWQEDEAVELDRWERRALLAIDRAWMESQAAAMAAKAPRPPS